MSAPRRDDSRAAGKLLSDFGAWLDVTATFLQAPGERRVGLRGLVGGSDTTVRLLGGGTLELQCTDDRINVTFPDALDVWPAYALKITPKPQVVARGG